MLFIRAISFLLIAVIMAVMVQPSAKIISFYQNQAEIIAQHCINKDRPALKCEGQCYLEKELKQVRGQNENSAIPEVTVFMPIAINCLFSIVLIDPTYISKKAFFRRIHDEEVTYSGKIDTPPKIII